VLPNLKLNFLSIDYKLNCKYQATNWKQKQDHKWDNPINEANEGHNEIVAMNGIP